MIASCCVVAMVTQKGPQVRKLFEQQPDIICRLDGADPVGKILRSDLKVMLAILEARTERIPSYSSRTGEHSLGVRLKAFQAPYWKRIPGVTSTTMFMKSRHSFEYKVAPSVVGKTWRSLKKGEVVVLGTLRWPDFVTGIDLRGNSVEGVKLSYALKATKRTLH